MKVNRGLIFISIIIISLIAVGAVSASENVSDVIQTSDFDEVVTVEDNIAVENTTGNVVNVENKVENSDVLAIESENEPVSVNVEENEVIKDSSSSNRFDWNALYNNTGVVNNSLVYDFSNIFGKNTGSSFLVLDLNNLAGNSTTDHSYLVLGLSSILGLNSTNDNSYLVFGLSSILDDNNTDDDSYLVLDVPNLTNNGMGNASLIIDLTNLLDKNGSSMGSFLYFGDGNNSSTIDLSGIYKNNTLGLLNISDIGSLFNLSNLVDALNLTDLVNGLNLTDLFNVSALVDALNLTDLVNGLNLTDLFNVSGLVDALNLTDFVNGLNLTDWINGWNITNPINITNGTSINDWNSTSWIDDLWNKLFGPNVATKFADITVFKDSSVSAALVDEKGNPIANAAIKYIINNESMATVTDSNGRFTIKGKNGEILTLIYEGTAKYMSTNATIKIDNVASVKQSTVIVGNNFTQYALDYAAGERGQNFTAKLTDVNGNALANKKIFIGYNGKTLERTTDANGFVYLQINLKDANRLTFAVVFLGDEDYNATMAVYLITINKKPVTVTAAAKTYKASAKTKKYTITLKTTKGSSADGKVYFGAGKKVTLKVNGKTYTAKTNAKGQATFNLKITKKGKFTASINYAGDTTYKTASKSVKITIK